MTAKAVAMRRRARPPKQLFARTVQGLDSVGVAGENPYDAGHVPVLARASVGRVRFNPPSRARRRVKANPPYAD